LIDDLINESNWNLMVSVLLQIWSYYFYLRLVRIGNSLKILRKNSSSANNRGRVAMNELHLSAPLRCRCKFYRTLFARSARSRSSFLPLTDILRRLSESITKWRLLRFYVIFRRAGIFIRQEKPFSVLWRAEQ